MDRRLIVVIGLIFSMGHMWVPSGLSQTGPQGGRDQVVIQARSGIAGLVIGEEVFRVAPEARILDEDGRPTTLDRISLPTDATVGFVVSRQGEVMIEYIKIEDFPQ